MNLMRDKEEANELIKNYCKAKGIDFAKILSCPRVRCNDYLSFLVFDEKAKENAKYYDNYEDTKIVLTVESSGNIIFSMDNYRLINKQQ